MGGGRSREGRFGHHKEKQSRPNQVVVSEILGDKKTSGKGRNRKGLGYIAFFFSDPFVTFALHALLILSFWPLQLVDQYKISA